MAEARLVGRELLSGRCWRRACRQGRVGSQAWSVWFPLFQGPRSCCDVAAEAGDPLSLGGGGVLHASKGCMLCGPGPRSRERVRMGLRLAWPPTLASQVSSHRTHPRIRRGS